MWAKWGRHLAPGSRTSHYDQGTDRPKPRRSDRHKVGDRASIRRLLHPQAYAQDEDLNIGKMPKKSKEDSNGHAPVVFEGEVCLLTESPFRILKVSLYIQIFSCQT